MALVVRQIEIPSSNENLGDQPNDSSLDGFNIAFGTFENPLNSNVSGLSY